MLMLLFTVYCLCGNTIVAPALIAQSYLEGYYSEIYQNVPQNTEGVKKLFRQFSTPGGMCIC
jgi:xylulose-5-phosphate/fructose-6-phosphate phosphoketolase